MRYLRSKIAMRLAGELKGALEDRASQLNENQSWSRENVDQIYLYHC